MAPSKFSPGCPIRRFGRSKRSELNGIIKRHHARVTYPQARYLEGNRGQNAAGVSGFQHMDLDIDISSRSHSLTSHPTPVASQHENPPSSEKKPGRHSYLALVPAEKRLMREALKLVVLARSQITCIERVQAIRASKITRRSAFKKNELKFITWEASTHLISDPPENLLRNLEFRQFYEIALALDRIRDTPVQKGVDEGLEMVYADHLRAGIKGLEDSVKVFVKTRKEQIESWDARAAHCTYVGFLFKVERIEELTISCRLLKIQAQVKEDHGLRHEQMRRIEQAMVDELSESMRDMRTT